MTTWAEVFDKTMEGRYTIATVLAVLITMSIIFYVCRKALIKYLLHEKLGLASKADLAAFREAVKADSAALREAVKADSAALREEIKTNVAALNASIAETNARIEALRAETQANIAALNTTITEFKEETKAEFAKTDAKIVAVKTELRENDLFHISKAMLLIGAEVLKNNPERFERVKDTILETTPDNKKHEIKSITP